MKPLIICISLLIIPCVQGLTQDPAEMVFYMVDTPESFGSYQAHANQISMVCPQTFFITVNGVLNGSVDPRVLEIAEEHGIKVMPLIVNRGFSQDLLHEVVSNPESRRRSIEMMLAYAEKYGLDGWQFDLEGLHISDRDAFTQYFRETAEALHRAGLQLSAALVHNIEEVGGPTPYHLYLFENWRAGYDVRALAEIGDFLSIMTYDQHTRRTPPGPVASPKWMEQVVQYMIGEGVPASKISLGIPTYSVYWHADYTQERGGFSNGRQVGYNWVEHLLGKYRATPIWDASSGCHYARWENGGNYEYLYIEDGRSLDLKLDIVDQFKLRGVSVWVLGREASNFWSTLNEYNRKHK
jgi:spore germination protein YaaH